MSAGNQYSDFFDNKQNSIAKKIVFGFFRWIKNYFIIIGFLMTLLPIWTYCSLSKMVQKSLLTDTGPSLEQDKEVFLNLKLQGAIEENSPKSNVMNDAIDTLFGLGHKHYILDIKNGLKLAAKDPRVKGLFLELHSLSGSLAAFTELRDVILSFKNSDKPIYAWMYQGDHKSYYIASVAEKIFLAPVSDFSMVAPSFELIYFSDALHKLGVEIDVIRAGKFKSAFEPFILNAPSSETKLMYQTMEESLRQYLSKKISESRLNADELETIFKKSFFTPKEALKSGLVDELSYLSEAQQNIEMSFHSQQDEEPLQNITAFDFYQFSKKKQHLIDGLANSISNEDGIGIIEAVGEIHLESKSKETVITPKNMKEQIDWALKNDRVKGVVLRIASPGGSAVASDIIWHDINRLTEKKPVVVSMGSVAASGGYYIAAPAKKIFADPTTITGSIGVIGMVPNFNKFREKYGVSFHMITSSERKKFLNKGTRPSSMDKKLVGQSVDVIYQAFIAKVAQGRGKSIEEIDAIAQGRVWTGIQAKKIGLVDELGGLLDAINEVKILAKLKPEHDYPLHKWQAEDVSLSSCINNIRNCFPNSSLYHRLSLAWLPRTLSSKNILNRLENWSLYFEDEPIQALWPGTPL